MNKTQIEWVKNPDGSQGYTFNPITGCLNNCPYCYARRLANGRLKHLYLANENVAGCEEMTYPRHIECMADPFYPRFWPERLGQICFRVVQRGQTTMLYGRKQRGILVCDMSDLFGIGIPESWTEEVLYAIKEDTQDRLYLLTKQPQNLPQWSPFPDNCWVGVTITNGMKAIEETGNPLACLKATQAKVKYISFEPLLSMWDTEAFDCRGRLAEAFLKSGINWVIIGAQTKPYKPPKIEWVQEIVEAADKASIPVFLKDNLRPLFASTVTIKDKWVWAKDLGYGGLYRQEMPVENNSLQNPS